MFPPPAIAAKYTNWRRLGGGGFGQVYKVKRIADEKVRGTELCDHLVNLPFGSLRPSR